MKYFCFRDSVKSDNLEYPGKNIRASDKTVLRERNRNNLRSSDPFIRRA